MAKRDPYTARVKYWGDGYTGDANGKTPFCIAQMFRSLPQDQQADVIYQMQKISGIEIGTDLGVVGYDKTARVYYKVVNGRTIVIKTVQED